LISKIAVLLVRLFLTRKSVILPLDRSSMTNWRNRVGEERLQALSPGRDLPRQDQTAPQGTTSPRPRSIAADCVKSRRVAGCRTQDLRPVVIQWKGFSVRHQGVEKIALHQQRLKVDYRLGHRLDLCRD
jgi:hypothetical protein